MSAGLRNSQNKSEKFGCNEVKPLNLCWTEFSLENLVSFFVGRLREVFLRGEVESICPEGTRATSPNLRTDG